MRTRFSATLALGGLLLTWGAAPAQPPERPIAAFSIQVDLGEDVGQSFGSLFEARDDRGRVVAGAGFQDVYNTRFRSDRHTLQFFVRPRKESERFTVEPLPHPDLDCGIYLFDLNEKLYAWSSARGDVVRSWDAKGKRWKDEPPPALGPVRSGDGAMRVGAGMLVFGNSRAQYEGRNILEPPATGIYHHFYYAHGRLCFYHTHRKDPGGFTRLLACPWTPRKEGPIDLAAAAVLRTKYTGETPFAYGQYRGTVFTVSNMGGVYAFDGTRWKTLLEPDHRVSYQVYSMLNHHDRLLLAQYPTGSLFEYQGKDLKLLEGWPPRIPGVSPSAREAQTLAIYRGDLFVGVWPWAEVWRHDADADKWHSLGRMFTHPKVTDKTVHPYEAEATRHGLVANHWGQRVTGMVPLGDALMLSTSSKGTSPWDPKYTFLTEKQRREYGAVLRLKMPGNLAGQIRWTGRPVRLDFLVHRDRLVIRQDGKPLATSQFALPDADLFDKVTVSWGKGVFGPFDGKILERSGGKLSGSSR